MVRSAEGSCFFEVAPRQWTYAAATQKQDDEQRPPAQVLGELVLALVLAVVLTEAKRVMRRRTAMRGTWTTGMVSMKLATWGALQRRNEQAQLDAPRDALEGGDVPPTPQGRPAYVQPLSP